MLSPDQLRTALDRAGIGHTVVPSLRHPDRWVTAGAVSVEDFAGAVEAATRAQVEPLVREMLSALEHASADSSEVLEDYKQLYSARYRPERLQWQQGVVDWNEKALASARAWLAAQPKEAEHADPQPT